jgi:hypothetical protein
VTVADSSVADVVAKVAIREVIDRYCRGIDRADRDLVNSCYHPDATDHHGSFSGSVAEYLDWCFGLLAKYDSTFHFIGNCLIEVDGLTARAESYGIARHRSNRPEPLLNLTTGFRFLDRFVQRDGAWRIVERVAVTDWSQTEHVDSFWPIGDHLLQGSRDHSDPSYRLFTPSD